MSEFSGWMEAAVKMFCLIAAIFALIAALFVTSWLWFGWKGPVGLLVLWFGVSIFADTCVDPPFSEKRKEKK